MNAVLNTPELLELILCSFPAPVLPDILLNCALVSKSWTWIALEILWGREEYTVRSGLDMFETYILENMVRSLIKSGSFDSSRPLRYTSLLASMSLSQDDISGLEHLLPLLSFPGAFHRLRRLHIRAEATTQEKSAVCLAIALHLATPRLRTIIFESEEQIEHRGILQTLLRHSSVLTSLEHIQVEYLDDESDWVSSALTSNLGAFRTLKNLELRPVIQTCEFFYMLANNLPRLEILKCFAPRYFDDEDDVQYKPPALRFDGPDMPQFPSLKSLHLFNAPENIREVLRLFNLSGNVLQQLWFSYAASIGSYSTNGIFPDNFAATGLNHLEVCLTLNSTTARNLSRGIRNLFNLRILIIKCSRPLPMSNDELVAALQPCHWLEILSLGPNPGPFLAIDEATERLTLGCLGPLLSSHPFLQEVKGTFDLDLDNFSWDISPHPKLELIDLGMSYIFSTQPWGNWVPQTAGYLSGFFGGHCNIKLSPRTCVLSTASGSERRALFAQRAKDLDLLINCVQTINTSRKHLLYRVLHG